MSKRKRYLKVIAVIFILSLVFAVTGCCPCNKDEGNKASIKQNKPYADYAILEID